MTSGPASPSGHEPRVVQSAQHCHSDVRRHFVPEFGRRAWHYHQPGNCRPVETDAPASASDCHRDVRRHYLPSHDAILAHRHIGPDCRVQIFRPFHQGIRDPGECVRIGLMRYCEN